MPRPSGRKLLGYGVLGVASLVLLAGMVIFTLFVISAWLGLPIIFGDQGPDQPIAFPHTVHVQQVGIDCTFCHRNVTRGAAATIPPVGFCMTCHKVAGTGRPGVEQLRAIYNQGQSIDWVRVHRVPDHVHFSHEPHITFFSAIDGSPSAVCARCHGDVGGMVKVKQVMPLKMDDCVNCHRDNGAPTDCTTCHY